MASRKKLKCKRRTQLLNCVMSDKLTEEKLIDMRRHLEQRADVNAADNDGNTLLHLAVRDERVTIIKLLLKRGANVNARDQYSKTPLHDAVCYREMPVVKLLLKYGADVHVYDAYGNTALHEAARIGDASVVELLLDNGADINAKVEKGRGYSPLHEAARFGQMYITELLLSRGANVYERDRYGSIALHEAASSGNRSIVELFLNKGVEVNDNDQFKSTPLHSAASSREITVVELLLSRGADVNAQSINGDTPLHRAARSGDISIVTLLLKNNAKVNPYTKNGNTPLHEAVRSGKMTVIEELLHRGAKVNVQAITTLSYNKDDINENITYGRTPLHEAARSGNISAVKLLLEKDADVNLQDIHEKTALFRAVCSKVTPIVELLVNKGADVNVVTTNGNTLVHVVLAELRLKFQWDQSEVTAKLDYTHFAETSILIILLNKGVNINLHNENGDTPLHLAAQSGLTSIVNMLLNYGADLTAKDKYDNTPLHKAADSGKISIVELLLRKGADINSQNKAGDTPLHKAVLKRQTSIVELLLNNYAEVNGRNYHGETPLHCASKSGLTSIIEQLIDKGADLNAKTETGRTPLQEAVRCGMTSAVKLLLSKTADINAQKTDGETPLHIAVRYDNINLVKLLLNYGADVMLTNKAGETPFSYALFISLFFSKSKKMIKLLQAKEKEARENSFLYKDSPQNHHDVLQNYEWDNRFQNKTFRYAKMTETSGLPGQLYETRMICLVLIRVLNHEQIEIEHDFLLGTNIDGIGAMDDICLRCRVKGQQRPVLLFIQIKHKKDHYLTDKELWSDCEDFSLLKYFDSYRMIKKRFQIANKDPIFEGDFNDIDCYFILYTSAKEKTIKKNENKVNTIVHDLINTGKKTEPFQYSYDEADICRLTNMIAEDDDKQIKTLKTNSCMISSRKKCDKNQIIDFLNRFWIYPSQAKEDEVEHQVKDEINRHYNKDREENSYKFMLHTNLIFCKSHDKIQKWWLMNDSAPYLSRSNDFFKHAKLECIHNASMTIYDSINNLQLSINFQFDQQFVKKVIYNEDFKDFNTSIGTLSKIINKDMNLVTFHNTFYNYQNTTTVHSMNIIEQYKYSKRSGTSQVGGSLFRTKMIFLVYFRAQNYEKIEQNYILEPKIDGINTMSDICLRFQEKDSQRSVVLFLELIHRENLEKGKLTDEALWNSSGEFYLKKYFNSYLMIKERFRGDNENPIFEEEFCDVDCFFIVYTSAKESLTKKKTEKRVSEVVHSLINTGQNSDPFQYDYDEADINRLSKAIVIDQVKQLGTIFLQLVTREKDKANLTLNWLISRYHVVMAQEVLQQCKVQPKNIGYRLWQFRSDFFYSDNEYLVVLKNAFHIFLSSKQCDLTDITSQRQENYLSDDNRKKLLTLKITLPLWFGNIDMTFRGSKHKIEKRMKTVADKFVNLLKINRATKIVKISDINVGPGKDIEQGIIDVNGGIGGAVGNLLVSDKDLNMLKFDIENDALPYHASLFLKELKNERYKPFNQELSTYRIKVLVNGFPKYSFNEDEYDEMQARDFLNKFWFYPGQAKHNEVERILKNEMDKKYSAMKICNTQKTIKNDLDIIFLYTHDSIQKWWLQTNESPYLTRASELLERADQANVCNLLLTIINFMYIAKIYSIDIKVNRINDGQSVREMFQKMIVNLFKVFDPGFSLRLGIFRFLDNMFEKPTFCLKIHPEMEWAALTITYIKLSEFEKCDVKRSFIAKAGPGYGHRQARDGFRFYELHLYGRMYGFGDCLNDTYMDNTYITI